MPRANARAASRQSVYKNEGVYSATQGYAGFSLFLTVAHRLRIRHKCGCCDGCCVDERAVVPR